LFWFIEVNQIADHSIFVDLAAQGDLQNVVMPVAVRVVTFAVGGPVFNLGHLVAVEAMGCGEAIASIEVSLHAGGIDCVDRVMESHRQRFL